MPRVKEACAHSKQAHLFDSWRCEEEEEDEKCRGTKPKAEEPKRHLTAQEGSKSHLGSTSCCEQQLQVIVSNYSKLAEI